MNAAHDRKICILYVGGTIGKLKSRDGTLRQIENPTDFIKVVPNIRRVSEFDFFVVKSENNTAINKDSTDMVPADWQAIAKTIYEKSQDKIYEGFLVIHGVDTMAFAASAVAFALGSGLNFPVVFTGGQTMVTQVDGDGQINLLRGAKLARQPIAEVMISFNNKVFRACRAQKVDDRDFAGFDSPSYSPLALIKDSIDIHPFARKIAEVKNPEINLKNYFQNGIMVLPLVPTCPPDIFEVTDRCNGVILLSFGGQNVPFVEGFSYIAFIEKMTKADIPVVVASHFAAHSTEYDLYPSGKAAKDAGAIPVSGLGLPALVAKFSWILGQVAQKTNLSPQEKHDLIEGMWKNIYVGEGGDDRTFENISPASKA